MARNVDLGEPKEKDACIVDYLTYVSHTYSLIEESTDSDDW